MTCVPAAGFAVTLSSINDILTGQGVTNGMPLEAHGAAGDDEMTGTPNSDRLYGDPYYNINFAPFRDDWVERALR